MASLKTKLVKSQNVTSAINLMLRSWAAKVTAAQGSKQLAADVLADAVSNYSGERWQGEIPTWQGGDTSNVEATRANLFSGVMTLEKAFECIDDAANDCITRYATARARQNRKQPRWRWWVSDGIAKQVMARERLMTRTALEALTLRKGRRAGRQKISTTRRSKVPASGPFVFGGRKALRMPVGRPSLPADTWLARYSARKSRRQKRNATSIRRNRGTVTLPSTRFPRPESVQVLGR
jgi:hypothetical protein